MVLVIVPVLGVAADLSAGKLDGWYTFTSTSQVRYMDYFDDSLQVVSSGGWLKIDPATLGMSKVTNTAGLGTNDLYYIVKDSEGAVWLAGKGRLIKFKDGIYTPYLFFDREGNLLTLYTMVDDGDVLWVGTSRGLALFSKEVDDGQIEDFYFRFGELNPEPGVYDILILGDSIWIATSDGLAVADKSDPDLLKSFVNWATLRPSGYSPAAFDSVLALAYYRDRIYFGTAGDVFRLDVSPTDTSLFDVPTRDGISVKHMKVHGDSLITYASGGFFIYGVTYNEWNYTPAIPNFAFSSGVVLDTVHWVGNFATGVYYGSGSSYEAYDDGGLPGNQVSALASTSDGRIIGGFSRDGLAVFHEASWDHLDFDRYRAGIESIVIDDSDNVWVGTYGYGASLLRADTVITFGESNSPLLPVPGSSDYIVINGVARFANYVFMLNFDAPDDGLVRVVDVNDLSQWASFQIPVDYLYSIDAYGRVFVVGTMDKGIFYYYYGDDPFDKADDSVINLTESNSRLRSDNVRTVRFDYDGNLWVGTRFGLSRYDYGRDEFANLSLPGGFGPEVSSLAFDRRGNLWLGSYNGLAGYDAGSGDFEIYNTLNSGLTDDEIKVLMVHPQTNELWVGTDRGISVMESIIGKPTGVVEEVVAFPNPFVIGGGNDRLSFNYDGNAEVRIYTVNGELVRKLDINVPWDGRNESGNYVAPGVYLFLVAAEEGGCGKGKVLVIRE